MKPIETDAERSDALAALLAGHYLMSAAAMVPSGAVTFLKR